MSGGATRTPFLSPGQEIALTPATTHASRQGNNDDDLDFDAETPSSGKDGRRAVSIRSAKTDRSYLFFLRGPGEDPWSGTAGRPGVPGQDGLPAMPHTAARPDSAIFPPYGSSRKPSIGGVDRARSVSRSEYERTREAVGRRLDEDGAIEERQDLVGKEKKLPPPPLGLQGSARSVTGQDRARASVPVSEDGMRNWVIELDPSSPTTTVARSVSRPHSYTRGW